MIKRGRSREISAKTGRGGDKIIRRKGEAEKWWKREGDKLVIKIDRSREISMKTKKTKNNKQQIKWKKL